MGSRYEHRFAMTVGYDDDRAFITVDGDLDRASASEFEAAVLVLIGSTPCVTVDITSATMIDSAALGAFIKLHRRAEETDDRLEIIIGPDYQQRLFDVAGLSGYLHLQQSG